MPRRPRDRSSPSSRTARRGCDCRTWRSCRSGRGSVNSRPTCDSRTSTPPTTPLLTHRSSEVPPPHQPAPTRAEVLVYIRLRGGARESIYRTYRVHSLARLNSESPTCFLLRWQKPPLAGALSRSLQDGPVLITRTPKEHHFQAPQATHPRRACLPPPLKNKTRPAP